MPKHDTKDYEYWLLSQEPAAVAWRGGADLGQYRNVIMEFRKHKRYFIRPDEIQKINEMMPKVKGKYFDIPYNYKHTIPPQSVIHEQQTQPDTDKYFHIPKGESDDNS